MQQQKPPSTISIFCAAAPCDATFLAQWERHLLPLLQAGRITLWSEQHLMVSTDRHQQINEQFDHAHVIVFLLSAEFFASDECMALMQRALEGSARIIPLLLRPVDWQTSKLADLACLPANGQFVTTWDDQDQALHTCVDDLRRLLGLPAVSSQSQKPTGASALQNQNRARMLGRLRRSYRDQVKQSLQGATWLELGIAEKPDAVQNAANLLLRIESRKEELLPPGTSITKVYDEAEHELLILGEPGAGKSTLLLDLAEHLVERAETDETHPLPVILPISSWATKRPKLADWIAEQLAEIYDVPRKLSEQWVQEERILPLLDGLDEMDEAARPACIAAINTYHREHLIPLVICSRTAEYEAASEHHRLALQGAVVVQPLTHEHVDTYLVQAGKPLAALRGALKKNAALYDLATTPLMLNILILTYQGKSVRGLSSRQSLLLQQVWDDYVQRMVERKGDCKRYPSSFTRARLSYLARQMREHNQTVFYLEHLQPDWLDTSQQRTYTWRAVRLPAIFIGVLASVLVQSFFSGGIDLSFLPLYAILGGLLGGLWHGPVPEKRGQGKHDRMRRKRLVQRLVVSACVGVCPVLLIVGLSPPPPDYTLSQELIAGFSFGMIIGLDILLLQYLSARPFHLSASPENSATQGRKQAIRLWSVVQGPRALQVAVITGLGIGLARGLSIGLSNGLITGLREGLDIVPNVGATCGLISLLVSLVLGIQTGNVHLTERLRWTLKSLLKSLFTPKHLRMSLFLTGITLLLSGLSTGLAQGPIQNSTNEMLIVGLGGGLGTGLGTGLAFGLSYWLLLGILQGIAHERIEDQDRRSCNQGIKLSFRNSLIIGIISIVTIGVVSELSNVLNAMLSIGLSYMLTGTWGEWSSLGWSATLSDALTFLLGGAQDGISISNTEWLLQSLSALVTGISGGLLVCAANGGLAVLRHYTIRFLLWHSHTFPWIASQFLDDATVRVLLRRVGGGYSFAHRLLLDHLADQALNRVSDSILTR